MVNVLYQENDWVYVIAEDQREGFIPHSYCAPYTPHGETMTVKKKLPRDLGIPSDGGGGGPGGGGGAGQGPCGGGGGGGPGGEGTNQHNTTLNSTSKTCVSIITALRVLQC